MLSWHGHPPQALLIASGFPGEGKTTVALNLSYALAKQGTDLPGGCRPAQGPTGSRLRPDLEQGLSEVLTRRSARWTMPCWKFPGMPNLSILPAGTLKGNAGQLICSESMQQILQELRRAFSVRSH